MARENETVAEWQARMRSISVLGHSNPRPKEKIIIRGDDGADTGKRAKVVTDEFGTEITTSDNRQDVNIHPETIVTPLTVQGI